MSRPLLTLSCRARLAVLLVLLVPGLLGCGGTAAKRHRPKPPPLDQPEVNAIPAENMKSGSASSLVPAAPSPNIAGYSSEISVLPGQVLHMHVSTAGDARYRIEIYRFGWYHGVGGRLIACLPATSCAGDEPGVQRPAPAPDPRTGEINAGWPVTDSIRVGRGWVSGYYIAKEILTSGRFKDQSSYIPFIVRAPAGTRSRILVQASVNTWEAYNNWGGKSLYTINSTGHHAAVKVSFDRPFTSDGQSMFSFEVQLALFLEREGYDVSYQTDVDTDRAPRSLLGHRLVIVSGHDEYWSKTMRDAFASARDHGVNLAFLGGDDAHWQVRYADSDRTLIEYRSATQDPNPNPADKTVEFGHLNPPRPECQLLGVGFSPQVENGSSAQLHTYTVAPAAAGNLWFAHTALRPGDKLPHTVGYEFDGIQPGCAVPRLTDLLHWQGSVNGQELSADAVTYQAPSGARVFSDGTFSLVWLLDNYDFPGTAEDPRVQKLFRNIFNSLGGR